MLAIFWKHYPLQNVAVVRVEKESSNNYYFAINKQI